MTALTENTGGRLIPRSPGRAGQDILIDEEFDSERPVDEALIEWAADWHDESQEP